jgi:hypothetical protein
MTDLKNVNYQPFNGKLSAALSALACGLLIVTVYLAFRFNDYLDANARGVCWPEGRKLEPEEMRVRALKTILMEAQRQADMNNAHISQEYDRASLRILNKDMDESVLLSLSAKYPNIYRAIEEEKLIAKPIQFSRSEDAFYKELIDKKYSLISSEQGSFMGTATHYVVNIMRPSRSKIYEKDVVDKSIPLTTDLTDNLNGFGKYYLYTEALIPAFINQENFDLNYIKYYAINNCADYNYIALFSSKFTNSPIYSRLIQKREMKPSRSIFTIISEFIKGL